MKIYGGQLHGGKYQDQTQIVTTNLIEYLDAADYVGTGFMLESEVSISINPTVESEIILFELL